MLVLFLHSPRSNWSIKRGKRLYNVVPNLRVRLPRPAFARIMNTLDLHAQDDGWSILSRYLRPYGYPLLSQGPCCCLRASDHSAALDPIDKECLSGYRPSSYYPVKLGDVINQSYAVKVQLGFGRSSTTWFCTDQEYDLLTVSSSAADITSARNSRR